jgi:hypothetical protein
MVVVIRIIIAAAAALSLPGCASHAIEGHWVGSHHYAGETQDPKAYTLGLVDLKIDHGSYELVQGGLASTGIIQARGDDYDLVCQTKLNVSQEPVKEATIRRKGDDGLTFQSSSMDPSPVSLARKP